MHVRLCPALHDGRTQNIFNEPASRGALTLTSVKMSRECSHIHCFSLSLQSPLVLVTNFHMISTGPHRASSSLYLPSLDHRRGVIVSRSSNNPQLAGLIDIAKHNNQSHVSLNRQRQPCAKFIQTRQTYTRTDHQCGSWQEYLPWLCWLTRLCQQGT